MGKALDRLIDLLDLEQIEVNIFRGRSPRSGCSGSSAARWPDRPWSRPAGPCRRTARCTRCTRTSSGRVTRRCRSSTWWTGCGTGAPSPPAGCRRCSTARPSSPCPRPSTIPNRVPSTPTRCRTSRRPRRWSGTRTGWPGCWDRFLPRFRESPVDLRSIGPMSAEAARDPSLRTTRNLIWLRVDGDLPDDPLLHVCLMTYASDMTLLDSVLLGHGLSWLDGRTSGASLDHAMWFHRPFRADRWLLYAQDSPVAFRRPGPGPRRGVHGRGRARGLGHAGGADPVAPQVSRAGSRSLKSQVKKVLPPIGGNT
jgi:Acyl-CoA thioesterase